MLPWDLQWVFCNTSFIVNPLLVWLIHTSELQSKNLAQDTEENTHTALSASSVPFVFFYLLSHAQFTLYKLLDTVVFNTDENFCNG